MNSARHFAPYYRRFVAVAFDYLIVFFGAAGIQSYVLEPLGMAESNFRVVLFIFAMGYFTLSWWSPMSATPVQFLLRMRVVNASGEVLQLPLAALRGVLLIGGVVGAMTLFEVPTNPKYLFLAVPVIAVLFAGAFTRNRQAAHDYLSRSFVVMRDAVRSADARADFLEYASCEDPESLRLRRPSVMEVALALVAVGLPVSGLYSMALVRSDMELRQRISYAYVQTNELRAALQEFYYDGERWATSQDELGVPIRADYPDGGYYELEENGVVRIRFSVIPKLKKIQLVVSPEWNDGKLEWQCRVEGEVSQGVLPAMCRNKR